MTAVDDFNRITRSIIKANRAVRSPTSMKLIGTQARSLIVKRTRLGYGVDRQGGQKTKLAPLSDSYVAQRKGQLGFYTDQFGRLRKYKPSQKPKLDSTTRPGKSNLTRSGEMLRNIAFTVKGNVIEIAAKSRKNKQKVFWAHEGSNNRPERKFLFLTDKETIRVGQTIEKIFDLALNKLLGGN